MRATWIFIASLMLITGGLFHEAAFAGAPPGFIHLDAEAGCVFGNAPHHWFKPAGDGVLFGLVFESDDDDAPAVAIEIALTADAYQKLPAKTRKFYHNHADEVRMGEITLPGMSEEDTKKTLDFLATTYGRMIIISELADSGPHERTHIPTEMRPYVGTFWKYMPSK